MSASGKRNWAPTSLAEIAHVVRGRVSPQDHPELPFIGMDNVEAHTMRLLSTVKASTMKSASIHFFSGDVLYGRLRPYLNKVVAPDFEGLASAEFIPLTPADGIDPRFIQYRINASDFVSYASHLDEGDRPRVDYGQIAAFPLELPPTTEQRRIVSAIEAHLTRLDEAVAMLERVQRNLKRYRASVLKAAVEGRLVPTEAELARAEGRRYEPASVFLERALTERRRHSEATELAKVKARGKMPEDYKWKTKYAEPAAPDTSQLPILPEGWHWSTWDRVSDRVTVGHVGKMKDQYVSAGVPFLRGGNVRANRYDPEGLTFVSRAFHEQLSKSALAPGDVLIVRSGAVGTACVVPETLTEANCSDLVIVKQPFGINARFGAYYMNSLAQASVRSQQVGIALTHFNTKSAAALPIPVPPAAEQKRIVDATEKLLSVIDGLEMEVSRNLRRLTHLRQSVLKWAFEGLLVDQNPSDESASVLLERIRAKRASAASAPLRRGRRVNKSAQGA